MSVITKMALNDAIVFRFEMMEDVNCNQQRSLHYCQSCQPFQTNCNDYNR